MKKINVINFLEYLALALILSYFLIGNIYLVIIGIIFSIYLININLLYSISRSINKKLHIFNVSKKQSKSNKIKEANSNQIKLNTEDSMPTLVETIEELGFIPSIEKLDDSNTA